MLGIPTIRIPYSLKNFSIPGEHMSFLLSYSLCSIRRLLLGFCLRVPVTVSLKSIGRARYGDYWVAVVVFISAPATGNSEVVLNCANHRLSCCLRKGSLSDLQTIPGETAELTIRLPVISMWWHSEVLACHNSFIISLSSSSAPSRHRIRVGEF